MVFKVRKILKQPCLKENQGSELCDNDRTVPTCLCMHCKLPFSVLYYLVNPLPPEKKNIYIHLHLHFALMQNVRLYFAHTRSSHDIHSSGTGNVCWLKQGVYYYKQINLFEDFVTVNQF